MKGRCRAITTAPYLGDILAHFEGNRKVGVPDPEKSQVVVAMFERYASGLYSDMQMASWMNEGGHLTSKGRAFNKDTVRDMLCNPYYIGSIRYRGMTVRPKGVSFRSTQPRVSKGSMSQSSPKNCGNAARPYAPAGGWW